MAVTLELPPEIETQLEAQASARGLSLADYLRRIVEMQAEGHAARVPKTHMTDDEWERGFEALIDSFPQQPVLSDQAISRDSIYTREDDL